MRLTTGSHTTSNKGAIPFYNLCAFLQYFTGHLCSLLKCNCVTSSFVFRKEVECYPSSGACIRCSALMVGKRSTAKCIQHHCTLIHRTSYQHIINGPVILIQSIMFGLPPAETSTNSLSTGWQKDIYKAVKKKVVTVIFALETECEDKEPIKYTVPYMLDYF